MGQNLPLCAQLGATRSRQDESKEVGEVGSKRSSSGSKGEHHVWWGGLIFRLLPPAEGHGDQPAGNPETRDAIHSGALLVIPPLVGRRAGGLKRLGCC
jgi:hypothetical protein